MFTGLQTWRIYIWCGMRRMRENSKASGLKFGNGGRKRLFRGFFRGSPSGGGRPRRQYAPGEQELETPAQDHSECQEIEQCAGLFEREKAIKETAGQVARDGQDDDDRKERTRPLHHDDAVLKMEVRGE